MSGRKYTPLGAFKKIKINIYIFKYFKTKIKKKKYFQSSEKYETSCKISGILAAILWAKKQKKYFFDFFKYFSEIKN